MTTVSIDLIRSLEYYVLYIQGGGIMINLLINNQFSLPVRNARQENLKPGVRQDQGRVTPAQLRLAQPELPRYVGLDDAEGFAE